MAWPIPPHGISPSRRSNDSDLFLPPPPELDHEIESDGEDEEMPPPPPARPPPPLPLDTFMQNPLDSMDGRSPEARQQPRAQDKEPDDSFVVGQESFSGNFDGLDERSVKPGATHAKAQQAVPRSPRPPSPATSVYSQHQTGDAAGGTAVSPRTDLPAKLGRSVEQGAGVGPFEEHGRRLVDEESNPSHTAGVDSIGDAELLGTPTSVVEYGDTLVIADGFGGEIILRSGDRKSFEINVAVVKEQGGKVNFKCNNYSGGFRPPSTTNWVQATSDKGEIRWVCYARPFGLPAGAVFIGYDTTLVKGSGPLIVSSGTGDELELSHQEESTFPIELDAQDFFRWRCNDKEMRTRAPSSEVNWVRVAYFEGREAIWKYYSVTDVEAPAKGSETAVKDRNPARWPWRRDMGKKGVEEDPEGPVREEDDSVIGREGPRRYSCADFPFCAAHCPCTFACAFMVILWTILVLVWPGITVETDFDSFLEADSAANEYRTAFLDALKSRGPGSRRLSSGKLQSNMSSARRLGTAGDPYSGVYNEVDPDLLHRIYTLEIMYHARDGYKLMTLKVLREIRNFEAKLRSGKHWRRLCGEFANDVLSSLCEPGVSFVNILWPVNLDEQAQFHTQEYVRYNLSGDGREPLPFQAAVEVAHSLQLESVFFPMSYTGGVQTNELRSFFEFDLICCTLYDNMKARRKQLDKLKKEYEQFISEEAYPLLMKQAEDKESSFYVNWQGDAITSLEVWDTLMGDCLLAIGSASFILIYLAFHTRSPLISGGSILLAITSIPAAFIISARLSGGNTMTGASFLSLFLIVGLGADVVLVFVSFFETSRQEFGNNFARRVLYTYQTAGVACFATSLTTAASFFANLASVLKPLREFGFFMGLCIMMIYIFVVVALPPLLIANEKIIGCMDEAGLFQKLPPFVGRFFLKHRSLHDDDGDEDLDHEQAKHSNIIVLYFYGVLKPYRKIILGVAFVMPIVMLIWTAASITVDGEMPQMFPDDHNQNLGKKLHEKFMKMDEVYFSTKLMICNIGRSFATDLSCIITWCNIGVGGPVVAHGYNQEGISECVCMPAQEDASDTHCYEKKAGAATRVGATVRFIGLPEKASQSFWSSDQWKNYLKSITSRVNGDVLGNLQLSDIEMAQWPQMSRISTMVQEHWESGMISVASFNMAPSVTITIPAGSPSNSARTEEYCEANEVCYCGAPACKFYDESLLGPTRPESLWNKLKIPVDAEKRRLSRAESTHQQRLKAAMHARQLSQRLALSDTGRVLSRAPLLPPSGRRLEGAGVGIDVSLIWGIEVTGSTPLLGDPPDDMWTYDSLYRPDSPRCQRHMYKSCLQLSQDPTLMIGSKICWISEFREWLRSQNELFPARATRFSSLLYGFQGTGLLSNGNAVTDFMWLREDGSMRASYVSFDMMVGYHTTPSHVALKYKKDWDFALEALNDEAPMDAGTSFHTSRLWIRAEAEQAIIDSTVNTLLVSISSGFLGTFAFTHFDVMLSGCVVLAVSGVTTGLAWFMCVMMSWPFGAVEVLGLIVFVGYSITYSLHIAHKYGEYTKMLHAASHSIQFCRIEAVRQAMMQMSNAVTGSAITTLGSSFFLFFCTMSIFVKLAAVLFAVTFLACVFALLFLPAGLLVIGPVGTCGLGAVRTWMRDESFDFDVEKTPTEDRPRIFDFFRKRDAKGDDGGFIAPPPDTKARKSVSYAKSVSFAKNHGRESAGATNFTTVRSTNTVQSEVFVTNVRSVAHSNTVTPNSSPGIRPLVARKSAPPASLLGIANVAPCAGMGDPGTGRAE